MLSSADKRAIDKRLKAIMARYEDLDNALWYLASDPGAIRNKIRQYQTEINGFLKTETVNEQVVRADVQKSLAQFEKNLRGYLESGDLFRRRPTLEALQNSVLEQYAAQVDTVTGHIGNTLFQRGSQFRALAQVAEIPAARAAAVEGYTLRAVSVGGKQYNAVQLGKYWGRMLDEYGTRGSIQYRNGTNYPLTTYVQQRIQTSEAETDRLTSVVSSSAVGLTLGKINQTGTADSCIFWENKYVFMSDEAKAQTLAKYPKVKSLQNIPTVQDVKNDKTHMFKWNCNHRILPTSITVLPEDDFQDAFDADAARQPKVPKKIDERALYQEITGDKYEPKQGAPVEKLKKAAEIDVKDVSYTIQ